MSDHFRVSESGETVLDLRTGLTWQRDVAPQWLTWAEAQKYAVQLALDGGGWRLPTVAELFSLADRSRTNPAIDTKAFPNTPSTAFWSSTPYAVDVGLAWFVDFDDGDAGDHLDGYGSAVRCVRASEGDKKC